MSRDTKKELLLYQPVGDTAAMARHLEKRAEQGWLLERADNWWLRYRRAEPTGVRYAVAFFPEATIFDAAPVEGQETYYDYCRAAGWEYVCSYGSIQYFRNFRPAPVPIETDEALKLKTLRRVMLRTVVLMNVVWLLLAVSWCFNLISSFRWSPLSMVSQYSALGLAVITAAFLLHSLLELLRVGVWYLRSRWSVKRGGACARIRGSLQAAGDFSVLAIMLAGLGASSVGQGWGYLVFVLVYSVGFLLLLVVLRALLRHFKRLQFSNTASLVGSIAASVVLSIAFVAGMNAFDWSLEASLPPEWPKEVSAEELPLTLEDLGYAVTEADRCEYLHQGSGRTPWAAFGNWYQGAEAPDSELPFLNYQIADISWDWLRELCWDTIMRGPKYGNHQLSGYTPIDPAPWGADAAARRNRTQVLLYGERIVLVTTGWTPTEGEAAVIGAALGGR
ncbi:MAG: DUF2812 domain-containing protein [Oscillospiraceae bacterium]|nr:DUF2812 domain-containing protein [Oscillospiraceae bacterium]